MEVSLGKNTCIGEMAGSQMSIHNLLQVLFRLAFENKCFFYVMIKVLALRHFLTVMAATNIAKIHRCTFNMGLIVLKFRFALGFLKFLLTFKHFFFRFIFAFGC